MVDPVQYVNRYRSFDFDMTIAVFPQSLSPGNEQRDFWGSEAAGHSGSRNIIGITDPVVDALIDALIMAPDRNARITACKALDRVLRAGFYLVPNWHSRNFRIAYWNRYDMPKIAPKYGLGIHTWWQKQNLGEGA